MKKFVILLLLLISTFMLNMSGVLADNNTNKSWHPADNQGIVGNDNKQCPAFGDPTNKKHFAYYLQIAFNVIKFLGPVLVLLVTIVDLVKITAEQKQDGELAKMGGKTLKRIIYAGIIFILPGIISWLLGIVGLVGTCVS